MLLSNSREINKTASLYLLDNCMLSKVVQRIELKSIFSDIREFRTLDECLKAMYDKSADIIMMNFDIPYIDGISALKLLKQKFPDTKVIIHTSRKSEQTMLASFANGVSSYIIKGINDFDYKTTVKNVLYYGFSLDFRTVNKIFSTINLDTKNINSSAKSILSKRECEVLSFVAKGKSNTQIALELGITINTVKTQLKSILAKMKARDRTSAVVSAIKLNLIEI